MGYLNFFAVFGGSNEVDEHLESNLDRTVSYDIGNLGLELLCELIVTLTCDDGEDVGVEYVRSEHVSILTFSVLVYA